MVTGTVRHTGRRIANLLGASGTATATPIEGAGSSAFEARVEKEIKEEFDHPVAVDASRSWSGVSVEAWIAFGARDAEGLDTELESDLEERFDVRFEVEIYDDDA